MLKIQGFDSNPPNMALPLLQSLFLVTLVTAPLLSVEAIKSGGFAVDLIHRDSPLSPYYIPAETHSDRVRGAVQRTHSRLHYFRSLLDSHSANSSSKLLSALTPDKTIEYLMTFYVGTPPVKRPVIADTGSDLVWLQCKPCAACYREDVALFDPRNSSTYQHLTCLSQHCHDLPFYACGDHKRCNYAYRYGDGSVTKGDLATETFTFDATYPATVAVPGVVFGCGYNNTGIFDSKESGLAGLGRGPLSLFYQLGLSIDWKFSTCLAPHDLFNTTSSLSFGDNAAVSDGGAVSLPFVTQVSTFYVLTLNSITVGKKRISLPAASRRIIADSGTRFAILDPATVKEMEKTVSAVVGPGNVTDPTESFDLCYPNGAEAKFPAMTFQFVGGNLELKPANMFAKVSNNVTCLAVSADQNSFILGNLVMENFRVGYDLLQNTITFAPANCSGF